MSSIASSSSYNANASPFTPPRREGQDSLTSLREALFFYPEEDDEYYTAEEEECISDDEDSDYIPFEEMFGDAESMCSEDEEADDAEFERRQALLDSQYSFDEDGAAVETEFDDPFAGYSDNDEASPPPSPTVRPRVPSAGYPPHRCNCPHCPSRTEGFIPPYTPGSLIVENLPRQSSDVPIAPLILTPSVRKPVQTRSSHPGPSRSLRNNLDSNRRSEERNRRQVASSLPPARYDLERTIFTLPSIRTLDIWYDGSPTSPSQATSEMAQSSRMALSFILDPSPTPTPNQLSRVNPTRRPPEVEDVNDSDTMSGNFPWLSTLAPVINVSFIPDCSTDLIPYSLSLTRNVRLVHPSRDSNNRFEDLEVPGPLKLRDCIPERRVVI